MREAVTKHRETVYIQETIEIRGAEIKAMRRRTKCIPFRHVARAAPMADVGRRKVKETASAAQPREPSHKAFAVGRMLDDLGAINDVEGMIGQVNLVQESVDERDPRKMCAGIRHGRGVRVYPERFESCLAGGLRDKSAAATDVEQAEAMGIAAQDAKQSPHRAMRAAYFFGRLAEIAFGGSGIRVGVNARERAFVGRWIEIDEPATVACVETAALVADEKAAGRWAADRAGAKLLGSELKI